MGTDGSFWTIVDQENSTLYLDIGVNLKVFAPIFVYKARMVNRGLR